MLKRWSNRLFIHGRSSVSRTTAVITGIAVTSALLSGAPRAVADPAYQYVRTQSGQVRCVVNVDWVTCEHLPNFPTAPMTPDGSGSDDVKIIRGGELSWMEANIGGGPNLVETTLGYDQTYHSNGWTILPATDGTRFTNDGTGHGLFVSIGNVYAF
jgi:hypothetical protein